ncbi:MAG: DUF481 domain-containing protein [Planctomycetota bacterium]
MTTTSPPRLLPTLSFALGGLVATACGTVVRDPVPAPPQDGPAPAGTALTPPGPAQDEADWIRLVSGEWLKGEVTRMRDDSLEFDSEELDDLVIDWSDVAELRSPRQMQLLLDGRVVQLGRVHVVGDRVELVHDGASRSFGRGELLALIPGAPSEWNYWSGKLGLGLTVRSGNTDQTDATGHIDLARHTPETRLLADYKGAFSEVSDTTTANNHRASGKFDIFLSRRLFLMPAYFEYYRDPFQNIAYRLSPSVGLGYELIDEGGVDWNVTAGGGYQYTRFVSVSPGTPEDDDTAAVSFGTSFEWDLSSKVELDADYKVQVPVPRTDSNNHHLSVVLSVDLVGELELDLTFVWDRNGQVVADSSGVLPDPDDYRLTVGLTWDI